MHRMREIKLLDENVVPAPCVYRRDDRRRCVQYLVSKSNLLNIGNTKGGSNGFSQRTCMASNDCMFFYGRASILGDGGTEQARVALVGPGLHRLNSKIHLRSSHRTALAHIRIKEEP